MNGLSRWFVIFGIAGSLGGFHARVVAEPTVTPPAVATCLKCHGSSDTEKPQLYPRLAGQHEDYLVRQLLAFQTGRRTDPVMSPVAKKLDRPSIEALAGYFSRQPAAGIETQTPRAAGNGGELYTLHRCYLCHHAAEQRAGLPRGPVIAGQHRDYLVKAMTDIRSGRRPADNLGLMRRSLGEVSAADIKAMADYISTHTPAELQQ